MSDFHRRSATSERKWSDPVTVWGLEFALVRRIRQLYPTSLAMKIVRSALVMGEGEVLVHRSHRRRALTNGSGHPLHRPCAEVSHGKKAWMAGLER